MVGGPLLRRRGARIALASSTFAAVLSAATIYHGPIVERIGTWAHWPAADPPVSANPPPPVPVHVKLAVVGRADMPIYVSGIGTVQAYNSVAIKTRVDGEITQILFQEGQDVHQGDALAIIDPRPLQAQLNQQEAALVKDQALLDGAILDMKRYDSLTARSYVSRQQVDQQHALVDQYRAQIASDKAQIDYARTQLAYTTIRAPISGRLGIRQVDQGNIVHAADNTVIVTITQLQPISVIFTISAAAFERTKLGPGQAKLPVTLYGQDDKTELDRGTIEVFDNQVDPSTGTAKLKGNFANTALKLWPGNFVNGRIVVDVRHDGVTAPALAVRHGTQGDFVWLLQPDDTVKTQPTQVVQIIGDHALVDGDLAPGQRVVIDGFFRLENGTHVEFEDAGKEHSAAAKKE